MCWSASASVAMVAIGGAATTVTFLRHEPKAIWLTLGYFTYMEALQAAGYAVVDQCSSPANQTITALSYLHIALQPLFINAFAMAISPIEISARTRRWVWGLSGLACAILLFRLVPVDALGPCRPGDVLCGTGFCLVSGEWHIGWAVPLNDFWRALGLPVQFPSYMLAVFVLPLVYGAWRFVVFHAVFGPALAWALTDDPLEMPAIWCLFSIGLLIIALSPAIRVHVIGGRRELRQS